MAVASLLHMLRLKCDCCLLWMCQHTKKEISTKPLPKSLRLSRFHNPKLICNHGNLAEADELTEQSKNWLRWSQALNPSECRANRSSWLTSTTPPCHAQIKSSLLQQLLRFEHPGPQICLAPWPGPRLFRGPNGSWPLHVLLFSNSFSEEPALARPGA